MAKRTLGEWWADVTGKNRTPAVTMTAEEKIAEAKRLRDEAAANLKAAKAAEDNNAALVQAQKEADEATEKLRKAQNVAGYNRRKAADEPADTDRKRGFPWGWIIGLLLLALLLASNTNWDQFGAAWDVFIGASVEVPAEEVIPPADDDAASAVLTDEFSINGFKYADGKNFSVDPMDLQQEWVNFPSFAIEEWAAEYGVKSVDLVKDPGSLSLVIQPNLTEEAFDALKDAVGIDDVYYVFAGDRTEYGNFDYNSSYLRAHLYRNGGPKE